ncbi:MAG: hypothetical protein K2N38_09715 [Oscillospiraceae bacterium]|nr:hypothetical protein [Oscillospiraceae bacterium]
MRNITEELKSLLAAAAPETAEMPLSEDLRLVDDLGLDKTQLLLFAVSVEYNFDIRFVGAPEIHTLGDIIHYIKNYSKGLVLEHENGTYT